MPYKESVLQEKTFKEEGMEVDHRVFYTLSADKAMQTHRNSKAIALLVKLLRVKGVMSEDEIDDLLFECIN